MARLFFLFITVPLFELWLLITIGEHLGATPTIAIVFVTGLLGIALLKQQGRRVLATARERLQQGRVPGQQIAEGLLLFASGAFLMTPGVLTDLTGLALLLPPVRAWAGRRLIAWFKKNARPMPGPTGFTVGADPFGSPIFKADARVLSPEEVAARERERAAGQAAPQLGNGSGEDPTGSSEDMR